jgi:hypothetical protein
MLAPMIASVHVADIGRRSALAAMARPPRPGSPPGLRHANVALAAPLGGSILPSPDLGRVGLIALWDDDRAIDEFLAGHALAARLASGWHARLEPVRATGSWPGLPGAVPSGPVADHDGPAVVLTLGRLRLTQAVRFLRTSARAEAAVVEAEGLIWATGLARPPFVATCSLWRGARELSAYAYGRRRPEHAEAIAAHVAKPFHRESAFIRFRPYRSTGGLSGRNPLAEAWMSPGATAGPA